MEMRAKVLGFVPQKEIIYDKLLPYSEDLDKESNALLADIKSNLGRSVLLREIRPGCLHWAGRLERYIRLYGRKFSKEDHLTFIKLLFELVTIPDLEFAVVQNFAQLLSQLLKKQELISQEDLVLPWKPLYVLYESIAYSPYESYGMVLFAGGHRGLTIGGNISTTRLLQWISQGMHFGRSLESSVKTLIRICRVYFPPESTQEMLDEWRPLMCPFDISMRKALSYFELFLPTLVDPKYHGVTFKLWYEEFLGLWETCHKSQWESHLIWLMSRLAFDTIGHIDWEPYIPIIFTKLLRSIGLPIAANQAKYKMASDMFDVVPASNWLVAMMGGGSSCLGNISAFFKSLKSFYHPSNLGRWNNKLLRLLDRLPGALVRRLHVERYKPASWEPTIPDKNRLTDEEVTEFVEFIMPSVLLAMFNKAGSGDSAAALQSLSVLRPQLAIPPLIERFQSALETLTEPHQLVATMHCMISVARELALGGVAFPDGPSHVIPLLMYSLPGIDPNDIKKCMVTFQFISTFSTLIPLVDCSPALECRSDLSEREQELCIATRDLEDFVLQYMDRCFSLIETYSQEQASSLDRDTDSMNSEEGMLEVGLSSTFSAILTQSSPQVFQAALRKLYSFITGRVLETSVAGKYIANMCRAATSRVNSELALKMFLPHLCTMVMTLTDSEDIQKEEILDNELLFNMQLLSEIVRCDGKCLLPYRDILIKVLKRTLNLRCKEGYLLAGATLRHILKCLTVVLPLDYRSVPFSLDRPLTEYLPIRDWGRAGDIHNLGIRWHISNDEEKGFAAELLDQFLQPQIDKLGAFSKQGEQLSRDEVQQRLSIIYDCILGAGSVLPFCKSQTLNLSDSVVDIKFNHTTTSIGDFALTLSGGRNVREEVVNVLHSLLDHMLQNVEDDTKSLFHLIKIYKNVLFFWGISKEDLNIRWKSFHLVKKSWENKLYRRKQYVRALLIDRTVIQHEMRTLEKAKVNFTALHKMMMSDLLRLSTSHYSEVRSKAQAVLSQCFRTFPNCYLQFVPEIVNLLQQDPETTHKQYKGALYVIRGNNSKSLLIKHNWTGINSLWPAVVSGKQSEKPSIIRLLNDISTKFQKDLQTVAIKFEIPTQCTEVAQALWRGSASLAPSSPVPTDEEITRCAVRCNEQNDHNLMLYLDLVDKLISLLNSGELHWRQYQNAFGMLTLLIRTDVKLPEAAVTRVIADLVHETITIRKSAISAAAAILKQQKRKHKKVEVDPRKVGVNGPERPKNGPDLTGLAESLRTVTMEDGRTNIPGDNLWLQYLNSSRPRTKKEWDKTVFVDKTHRGYYGWSKPFLVYAAAEDQPNLDRTRGELSPEEVPIFDFFTTQANVDKLIEYLSLEDRKGKDKFDARRFNFFKGLFRNFGDTFLPLFAPHIERLAADTNESSQRCAAELIAGLIRGSKHWSYEKVSGMWGFLEPVVRTALSKMTVETVVDWGTCMATSAESRDPLRLHWLLELLMEDPLRSKEGSFIEASRLYALQGGLDQQSWRVSELLHRSLEYLKPYLTHPYQNVRERIGSVLTNIFMCDVTLPLGRPTIAPRKEDFIKEILPQLAVLQDVDGDGDTAPDSQDLSSTASVSMETNSSTNSTTGFDTDEKKTASMLLQTVAKWMSGNLSRAIDAAPPELFQLLPLLCQWESNETDEELKNNCRIALAFLGQAYLSAQSMEIAIETVTQIRSSGSWRARVACLSYVQMMVFNNLFTIASNPRWITAIQEVVIQSLEDTRVEVREIAAQVLGGLLHCELLKVNDTFLGHFRSKCSTKLRKRKSMTSADPDLARAVIQRHAGILGLCAYVNAHPYDVPQHIPDVLMMLGDHLNDPQPIPATIKNTLSNFRRTHHDNWRDHKLMFSDDQLAVLTDLLVSPSYYA